MVRATGLPRQIMRTQLREGFKAARYVGTKRCASVRGTVVRSNDEDGATRNRPVLPRSDV